MIRIVTVNNRVHVLTVTSNKGYGHMAYEDSTYEPGCALGIGDTIDAAVSDWVEQVSNKQGVAA